MENFDHKFCNCGRAVGHGEHKLDEFGEYIWKIERLRHNVHRFLFPWVFGVPGDSLSVPEKRKNFVKSQCENYTNLLSRFFLQKFRESNVFTKNVTNALI